VIVILDLSSGNMEGRTASDWPIPAGSYPWLQQSSGNSARTGLAVLIYADKIAPRCPRVASTVLNLQSHTPLESLPASLGPLSSRSCFLSRSLFIALVATASHYLRQFFRFQSPRVSRENGRFALRTPILRPDKHKEISDSRRPFVT
jgi:hypothetical protein